MNWRSTAGKSGLIKMLMAEHDLSKRKAEKFVNAVFDRMTAALKRGEEVELPVGLLKAVSPPARRKKQLVQRFRNIADGKIFHQLVRHPKRLLRFKPAPELIERGPFPPPLAGGEVLLNVASTSLGLRSKETVENVGATIEQLLCALMQPYEEISLLDFKSLEAAADGDLRRLIARLRLLVKEERKFTNYIVLSNTVRQLYWIR